MTPGACRHARTAPVDVWYGVADTGHSPDNGATLAARTQRLTAASSRESAVRWTHARDVLHALLGPAATADRPHH